MEIIAEQLELIYKTLLAMCIILGLIMIFKK